MTKTSKPLAPRLPGIKARATDEYARYYAALDEVKRLAPREDWPAFERLIDEAAQARPVTHKAVARHVRDRLAAGDGLTELRSALLGRAAGN